MATVWRNLLRLAIGLVCFIGSVALVLLVIACFNMVIGLAARAGGAVEFIKLVVAIVFVLIFSWMLGWVGDKVEWWPLGKRTDD